MNVNDGVDDDAGHSGLTSSRFDNALPLFNAHALYPTHRAPLDHQNWARMYSEKADQATATSPLRRPARRDSSSGVLFMLTSEL